MINNRHPQVLVVLGGHAKDVSCLKKIALSAKHKQLCVIHCDIGLAPENIFEYYIKVEPYETQHATQLINSYLEKNNLQISGIISLVHYFTQLYAHLTALFQLPGPKPTQKQGYSFKSSFRQLEQQCENYPEGYYPIPQYQISTLEELISLQKKCKHQLIVKPNEECSRAIGCSIVKNEEDCFNAIKIVAPFQEHGIAVEEYIEQAEEWRWHYMGGISWIEQKTILPGPYPLRIQSMIGEIKEPLFIRIHTVGEYLFKLIGANGAACHIDLLYQTKTDRLSVIEINLHPSYVPTIMAEHVFPNVQLIDTWLDYATGHPIKMRKPKACAFSARRYIQSPKSGIIHDLPKLKNHPNTQVSHLLLKWDKEKGDSCQNNMKDNDGYLGYICATSDDETILNNFLEETCRTLQNQLVIK